jgi:hypothetical protein
MLGSPASAQPQAGVADHAAGVAQRERDTNEALLAALIERRTVVVASPGSLESKRHALDFLDTRIARLRGKLGR